MKQLPDNLLLTREESQEIQLNVSKVFQPRTPIATREFFAGRWNQITTLADAINQCGLHVVIHGERGVGKTSLVNVVRPVIWAFDNQGKNGPSENERIVIKANAVQGDSFSSIWNKLFSEVQWRDHRPVFGLPTTQKGRETLRDSFGISSSLGPDDVRRAVTSLPGSVFIVDEFDRAAKDTSASFTDLIKGLSDFAVDCTIILVGVSDTVDQLIADHASISRALVQILLPRMVEKELQEILSTAEKALGIGFSDDAENLIVNISQGLPHYTHLLGLHAVRTATEKRLSKYVERADVFAALKEAVKQAQQTVTQKHFKATHSAHKDALYKHVLLACALTVAHSHDALGYFNPSAVVEHMASVMGRHVEIATFSNHLNEFCQPKRGEILERDGQPRAYRYRFRDPLIVPFVFMDAVATGLLNQNQLSSMLGAKF